MKQFIFILSFISAILIFGCDNSDDCYDQQLEESHSGICPADCPRVCGCDGVTYCNACEANFHGISEVSQGPCD